MKSVQNYIEMLLIAFVAMTFACCSSDSVLEEENPGDAVLQPSETTTDNSLRLHVGVEKSTRSIVVGPNDVLNSGEVNLRKIYLNSVGVNYGQYSSFTYKVNQISGFYEWASDGEEFTLSNDTCVLYASNIPMYTHNSTAVPRCYYYNLLTHRVKDGINEKGRKVRFLNKDTVISPTDYLYAKQTKSIDSIKGKVGSHYPINNSHVDASLNFNHVNSRIKLTFFRGTYTGQGDIFDVRLCLENPSAGRFNTQGYYLTSTGAVVATAYSDSISWSNDGEVMDVLPATSAETSDFTTFVAPFKLNSRYDAMGLYAFDLRFKIDKKEMELDGITFNEGWKAGMIYEYKIQVNNMTLHLQDVTVTAWMPDISNSYVLE